MWIRLIARGRAGHGSRFHPDNAVTKLAEAVVADRPHANGRSSSPTPRAISWTGCAGSPASRSTTPMRSSRTGRPRGCVPALDSAHHDATRPCSQAGYKHNVIPERAEALIDVRVIPGHEEEVLARLRDPRR